MLLIVYHFGPQRNNERSRGKGYLDEERVCVIYYNGIKAILFRTLARSFMSLIKGAPGNNPWPEP